MSATPGFRRIATRTVVDVQFLSFQDHDIETPEGNTVERIVITHPGAVAVVAVDGDDIILIEQYLCPLIIDIQKGFQIREIIRPTNIGY